MDIVVNVTETLTRQRIQVHGIVQGVGFRPFVYGLAQKLGLMGFVRNDGNGVTIEIEGAASYLDQFVATLNECAPPLARIDSVKLSRIPVRDDQAFIIVTSQTGADRNTLISPDVATCDDCRREMLDSADRRYHYPFINCTNCGPRFTIVQDIPYDRDKTTMREFPLCSACRAEYENPLDRRFHAQPNACPVCGPQIRLYTTGSRGGRATFRHLAAETTIVDAARLLSAGKILAIKGLGGYHLACDALNETAVQTLRLRKHREAKPFALMVADVEAAGLLCYLNPAERDFLQSRQRPIVLLRQRPDCPIAPQVAPNHKTLGVMLPYTPLHTLLLDAFSRAAREDQPEKTIALVMTSGNVSDEPIAFRDEEARESLSDIADAFLDHNREIQTRCDDSVVAILDIPPPAQESGGASPDRCLMLRRSRGYAPEPIRLPRPLSRPVLAVGGHLKNTFCLGKGHHAFVSHHIGDLDNLETLRSFGEGIAHYTALFDIRPEVIAHDLHPDYLSSKWALDSSLAAVEHGPIAIQHHHAHIGSVLAEHGLEGPVIGVAADGTGYGPDGAIWGGEIMVADLTGFERMAHLAYMPMPGGAQAIRQPWRMAAVYLQRAFGDDFVNLNIPFTQSFNRKRWLPLAQMIERDLNCPPTSSLGRLFDAVASLLIGRMEALYEGQAAIELEMMATPTADSYPFAIEGDGHASRRTTLDEYQVQRTQESASHRIFEGDAPLQLDVRPTIRAIVQEIQRGVEAAVIAGRFHRTVSTMLTAVCRRVRAQTGLADVALSGGVFQNRLLLEQLLPQLAAAGFQTYRNHQAPPNDGGLSLGQAAIAAAQFD